jgi:hypothetical protein
VQKPVPLASLRKFSSSSGGQKSGSRTEYNPAEFERQGAEGSAEPGSLPATESGFVRVGAGELADSREAACQDAADSDDIIEGESLLIVSPCLVVAQRQQHAPTAKVNEQKAGIMAMRC